MTGEERSLLEAVADQIPVGEVIVEAPSGRVILSNGSARELFGLELTDFRARRAFHPDGTAIAPHEWPLARAIDAGEVVLDEELELIRPDGTRVVTLVRAAAVRDRVGHIVAGVGTFIDITMRKRDERRQRLLADAGMVIAEGLTHADVLRHSGELVVPRLADHCEVYTLNEDGTIEPAPAMSYPAGPTLDEPGWSARLEAIARSGEAKLLGAPSPALGARSIILAPLLTRRRAHGVLVLAVKAGRCLDEFDLGTAVELSSRIALAADNAQLYELARAAARHREDVLAVVAHDLRNPLNAIRMTGALLARQPTGGPPGRTLRQHADLIERAAARMSALIDDLVDLGALQMGRLALHPAKARPEELVNEALDLHRFTAEEKEIALGSEIAPDLPDVVCDRHRILQVIGNLVGNALKVTPRGGSILVRVERGDEGVRFVVEDTGPGIAPANLARLFEPYWRGDGTQYRGTGLGLTIVKGIVSAHGGTVGVTSTVGAGTTFHFTLPVT